MRNLLLLLTLIVIVSCQAPKEELSLPMKVAKAYGIDNFDKVSSIGYTWNVQVGDEVRTRRWEWNVDGRMVTYTTADTSYTYSLDLPKEELPPADAGFINDKYWLLYPFQLAWDTGYTYEVEEHVNAPISGRSSTKLTIVYNNEDGYTPGDAYDLYLNDQYMIKEWTFRKGNGSEGRSFTWEMEKESDGILMATEHRNAEGQLFIWFSEIEVF
ncbi:hypothetical protein [Mongoliitalea lutea]|uniref:Uncharacterized protein n=1 Tax=Mongoliitalea lutea TaxID=849756 RepID=A0A8J3CYS6_9BACT|nr:hypothetical protein [Mongoliitalea lutea]GHB45711.1 hypothetical protein GCM10008106_28440 [Mongoliitalea lutea]